MKLRTPLSWASVMLAASLVAGCGENLTNPLAAEPSLDTTPPPAPTGLAISMETSLNRGVLQWSPSAAPDVAGYDVFVYAPDPSRNDAYVKVNTVPLTTTDFALAPVGEATTVYYRVRAVDQTGNRSAYSSTASGQLQPSAGSGGGSGDRDHFE
jgi:hypothetical protein